jgi:hypothetical protein
MNFNKLVDGILTKSVQTFGEEVIFYPKAGGVFKVRAIFDNDYQVVDVNGEQSISDNQPALGINLNDIKFDLKKNDEVEIRSVRFKVQEKKEDGRGGATLLLHVMKVIDANKDTKVR